jgi:hypothetical protein
MSGLVAALYAIAAMYIALQLINYGETRLRNGSGGWNWFFVFVLFAFGIGTFLGAGTRLVPAELIKVLDLSNLVQIIVKAIWSGIVGVWHFVVVKAGG